MHPRELLGRVRRLPITAAFGGTLAAGELGLAVLDPARREWVITWSSTNVARLGEEPLGPLLASPFVVLDHRLGWLVLGCAGLAAVESRLGWARTLAVALAAHVVGTAVSEAVIWSRVRSGPLPADALHQIDVGPSYVVVGALAAAVVVARPTGLRLAAAGLISALSPQLLAGLSRFDLAAVGHLTAAVMGGIGGWVCVVVESDRLQIQDRQPIRTR